VNNAVAGLAAIHNVSSGAMEIVVDRYWPWHLKFGDFTVGFESGLGQRQAGERQRRGARNAVRIVFSLLPRGPVIFVGGFACRKTVRETAGRNVRSRIGLGN